MSSILFRRLLVSCAMAAMLAFVSGGHGLTIVNAQGACESLVSLALPHTSITSAAVVPEGPVGGGRAGGPTPIVVPARCVVKAVTKPSSDSEIRFEVWMPVAGWNGKYQQAGNGGWAGSIPTGSLVAGVRAFRSRLALCPGPRRSRVGGCPGSFGSSILRIFDVAVSACSVRAAVGQMNGVSTSGFIPARVHHPALS
jgi:Tannase and feruloyl esterase